MGIPAPPNVGASGAPPAGDQANAVVQGQFTAIGASPPFAFYGAFNIAIWATSGTSLTTTAGSGAATVASGFNIAAGDPVNSVNVPSGTTVGAISGTDVTLAFPPGVTAAQVLGGADANAQFGGAPWAGTVNLERSFDGGQTWLICGIGGAGQPATYTGAGQNGAPVSIVVSEPEKGVLYRLNCTAYASGKPFYRLSASGLAAMAWGVPCS